MNILVIKSSVNELQGSYSSAITDFFVKSYAELNPNDNIEIFDLNKYKLANVSLNKGNVVNNKFWEESESEFWIEKLKKADKIVFSTSMTNFHYSATTKNFFDAIMVADKTFELDKQLGKITGLLTNIKNIQIITSQGAPLGWYPFGDHTNFIFQTFKWLGATIENKPFVLAGTKVSPNNQKSSAELVDENKAELISLAKQF